MIQEMCCSCEKYRKCEDKTYTSNEACDRWELHNFERLEEEDLLDTKKIIKAEKIKTKKT